MSSPFYVMMNEDGNEVAVEVEEIVAIEPGYSWPVGKGKTQPLWYLHFRSGTTMAVQRYKTDGSIVGFISLMGRTIA